MPPRGAADAAAATRDGALPGATTATPVGAAHVGSVAPVTDPGDADDDPDGPRPLLSYTVGRLDRAVRRRLAEVLERFDLSIPEFTTLSVLARRPGLSNAQLARRALIRPQSMNQVLGSLERQRLVERTPDPDHARILRATLTGRGRAVCDEAERATRAMEAAAAAEIPEEELRRAVEILDRLTQRLSDDPA
jgi:DNA-binding MarR family transcriptional regulator